MSDSYDDMEAQSLCLEHAMSEQTQARISKMWPMAGGERIHVSEMEDGHLERTIAKIKRDNWRKDWLQILTREKQRRAQRDDMHGMMM